MMTPVATRNPNGCKRERAELQIGTWMYGIIEGGGA